MTTLVEGKRSFFQQLLREDKQNLADKGTLARMDKLEDEEVSHRARINRGTA